MNISFCQIETDDSMDSMKGWKRCKHKKIQKIDYVQNTGVL